MPGLPAAIALFAAKYATEILIAKVILTAALIINGVQQAKRQRRAARDAYNASMRDRTQTIRSATASRHFVYGRARIGGVFIRKPITSGEHSQYLHLQIALLAGHEIDAIEDVWLGDESIGALDASGWVTGGKYVKTRTQHFQTSVDIPQGSGTVDVTIPAGASGLEVHGGMVADEGYGTLSYTLSGTTVTLTKSNDYAQWATVTCQYTTTDSLVRVKKFLGIAAGERDTELEALAPTLWKSTHVGKGVPRVHMTIVYDDDAFPNGLQNISVIVRGKKVYDTRTGVTAYSANSALCVRDYIVDPMGMGESASYVNTADVNAAANACDEAVPLDAGGTTTQARYTCGGTISTEDDRINNLGALLTSMVGNATYSGGEWHISAGVYRSPVVDVTDDDFADGAIELMTEQSTRNSFNSVRGKIIDPARGYVETEFAPYVSSTYVTEDGGEVRYQDISLPLTDDAIRAQRIAKLILHLSRQEQSMSAWFKDRLIGVQPGESIRLTTEYFGQSAKEFKVSTRGHTFPGKVQLVMQETGAAPYAWDYTEAIGYDPTPNSDLPDPRIVAKPANFNSVSGPSYGRKLADSSMQALMHLTWDRATNIGVLTGGHYDLWIKRVPDSIWDEIRIDGDTDEYDYPVTNGETYNAVMWASNGLARSDLVMLTHAVTGAPSNSAAGVTPWLRISASSVVFQVATGGSASPASVSLTALMGGTLSGTITWSVVSGTATLGGSGATRTLAYADLGTTTATIKAAVTMDGQEYSDLVTVIKVFDGTQGPAGTAKLLQLTVTSQVFAVSTAGVGAPASVAFTAAGQNLTGSPTFSVIAGTATLSGSGTSRSLDFDDLSTDTATIQCSWDGQTDTITVVKVRDGQSVAVGWLTNEAHVVAADAAGNVVSFADAWTEMRVFIGTTDDTANWTFTRTNGSGITSTLTTSGADIGKLAINTLTVDQSYVDITAAKSGFTSITLRFSISKSKTGAAGSAGTPGTPGLPGDDAITGMLTIEAIVLPADASGSVTSYAGAVSTMKVFKGVNDDSASWSFSRVNGTGVGSTLVGQVLTIDSLAVGNDSSYVDITATRSGYASVVKRVSLSKSKSGATGSTGNTGATGQRGTVQIAAATAGTSWSDAAATSAITGAGYASPVNRDMVTLYNSGAAYSETRYYDTGSWLSVNAYISGNLLVGGSLAALKATLGDVHTGSVRGGAFTGYAWPARGQNGFYLGPSGLLMGDYNGWAAGDNVGYVYIGSSGDFQIPGLSVSGKTLTISQVNVIDTLQVKGQAISFQGWSKETNVVNSTYSFNGPNDLTLVVASVSHSYSANGGPVIFTVTFAETPFVFNHTMAESNRTLNSALTIRANAYNGTVLATLGSWYSSDGQGTTAPNVNASVIAWRIDALPVGTTSLLLVAEVHNTGQSSNWSGNVSYGTRLATTVELKR